MEIYNPKLRISDYQDCVSLVDRLGFDPVVFQPRSELHIRSLEKLSGRFDLTQQRLLRLFHLFESGNDQINSESEVAIGLRNHGIYTRRGSSEADAAFQELIDTISTFRSGSVNGSSSSARHVHPQQFLVALRNLRLAAILHGVQSPCQEMCMNLHEYSENQLNPACPIKAPVDFLFKPAPELFLALESQSNVSEIAGATHHPVKWLYAHEASEMVILGLMVKYDLEPRSVLDVFTLLIQEPKAILENTNDTHCGVTGNAAAAVPNVNVSDSASASLLCGYPPSLPNVMGAPSNNSSNGVFLVVPILRLSEHSRAILQKYQSWLDCGMPQNSARGMPGVRANNIIEESLDPTPRLEIIVERCNLAIFVSDSAEGSTVISFSSKLVELMQFSTVGTMTEHGSAKCIRFCERLINYISDGRSCREDPISQNANGSKLSETADTAQLSMPIRFLKELRTSHSQVRCGDAHTFMLIALRDITEDYLMIANAYKACLLILQKRIEKCHGNLCSMEVGRITEYIKQLSRLNEVVERVPTVVETISSSTHWSGGAISYLSDIRSNVSSFLEDVSTCKKKAESILEELKQSSQTKTRSFLDTIALLVAMFFLGMFCKLLFELSFHLFIDPRAND